MPSSEKERTEEALARLIDEQVGKPSKVLRVLGLLLSLVAVGVPALLGVSFCLLLFTVLFEEPGKIWTSFFLFGILLPFAALVALLWAEVLFIVRLVRWKRRLTKKDPSSR